MYAIAVEGAQEAWEKGHRASIEGLGEDANPFNSGTQWVLWHQWRQGYSEGVYDQQLET